MLVCENLSHTVAVFARISCQNIMLDSVSRREKENKSRHRCIQRDRNTESGTKGQTDKTNRKVREKKKKTRQIETEGLKC